MPQDCEIRDAADNILQRLGNIERAVMERKSRFFAALAGPLAERLLQNREQTEAYLEDSDPKVRCAAIITILDYFGSSPAFEEYCTTTFLQDGDIDVRIMALSALKKVYQSTSEKKINRLLSEVLRNQAQPEKLRAFAYWSLFRISGKPVDTTIKEKILKGQFCIPDDVDWAFVDNFS